MDAGSIPAASTTLHIWDCGFWIQILEPHYEIPKSGRLVYDILMKTQSVRLDIIIGNDVLKANNWAAIPGRPFIRYFGELNGSDQIRMKKAPEIPGPSVYYNNGPIRT